MQNKPGLVQFQQWNPQSQNNHVYAPVLFESEAQLLKVEAKLKENNILARRYFYPSLNTLENIVEYAPMPHSESIAKRILCLPLYKNLNISDIERIIQGVRK